MVWVQVLYSGSYPEDRKIINKSFVENFGFKMILATVGAAPRLWTKTVSPMYDEYKVMTNFQTSERVPLAQSSPVFPQPLLNYTTSSCNPRRPYSTLRLFECLGKLKCNTGPFANETYTLLYWYTLFQE